MADIWFHRGYLLRFYDASLNALQRQWPREGVANEYPCGPDQLRAGLADAAGFYCDGAHDIEGVGAGFLPPFWDSSATDEAMRFSTRDATKMRRRLAREEGLSGGTSSGANVVAALRLAERVGREHTVVILICDSGMKYLSTSLYSCKGASP